MIGIALRPTLTSEISRGPTPAVSPARPARPSAAHGHCLCTRSGDLVLPGQYSWHTSPRRGSRAHSSVRCSADKRPLQSSKQGLAKKATKLGREHFLPLALAVGMTLGLLAPGPGCWFAVRNLQMVSTFGIFIISGLSLRRGEANQALQSWQAVLFGIASILLITPLVGLAALRLPLSPPELAFGLAVFCCMPTTLSSGVSLTQAVGGNTALALLLTTSTNLLGILTLPFMLCAVLGGGSFGSAIDPVALLKLLVKSILIPLGIGAAIRSLVPGASGAVDSRKRQLSMASAFLLAVVPWMQVSKAVRQRVDLPLGALAAVVAAGMAVHAAFLAFNILAVKTLNLGGSGAEGEGVRRALILCGSQKTLPIAVTVINGLAAMVEGPLGLAVIPCVCAHLTQILIDSMLVSLWKQSDERTVGGSRVPTNEFITKVSRNF